MANLSDLRIRIAADGSQAVRELDRVNNALDRHGREAAASARHAIVLNGAFTGLATTTAALFAGFASAQGLLTLVQGMVQAYTEVDRLNKSFSVVAGSSQAAAAEMAYVADVANRLGLEVTSSAEAYLSLTAAAKGTTLQGEQARGIFEAVSLAMAKLGKSAADTQGALLAVEQMISKGKVSAEELRGQLGERLPGAFQAAANAMGVTTAELDKLLSTGEVTAEEMLPKLTQELNRLYDDGKEVSGLTAEWNRFKNELSSAGATIADTTGLVNVLIAALANAASNAKALASWLNGEGWNNFATQVDRGNYLLTEKIRLTEEFRQKAQKVAELEGRSLMAEKLFPRLAPAQAELRALGNELGVVTSKLANMAEGNKQLAAAQTQSTDAAAKQTAATEAQAAAQAKRERALAKGSKAQKAATKEVETYADEVRRLIDQYLPAEAAALKWAETQALLNAAIAAGSITQEKATAILEAMKKEMAEVGPAAAQEAEGFAKVWADAVDSLDTTFQGLWRSLITGQGDVLSDLKATVLEWVADLSYQLLLSPLIVPIQTALLGGTGTAVAGTASSMASGAGTMGSIGNLFSSLSSGIGWFGNALSSVASGAIFSGISTGFGLAAANIGAAGYFGAMGTTLATAGSSFASGAIGTGIGLAAPYLLPALAALAAIAALSGAFSGDGYDHEPGYWGVSTGKTGVDNRFRGGRGVSGGFGLSFGVDAASTDEFDWDMWPEYEKQMAAMADMSKQLEQFYGEDVANAVEKALSDASGEGLWLLTHEFSSSFVSAFDAIIAEASKTGDDLAVVMSSVFSNLVDYTNLDTYATSIQEAMLIAKTALAMADDLAGTAMGDALKLTGDVVADAKRLAGYGQQVRKEGEGAADAFVRMSFQLALLDQAVAQTATDLSTLSADGVLALSEEVVDAFGSLDAASQAMAFYYDQFTTNTEKLVDAIQAAAKTIDREIPKLQSELIKLSEDIVQEVVKTAKELDTGLVNLAGALEETGNFWLDTQRRLADEWARSIADNAAAIADGSAQAGKEAVTAWQLWGLVEEGLQSYGDTLRELGYDVDHGAEAFLESLKRIRDAIADPLKPGSGTTIESITIPGDPNAAILAKLLDDLPKTRQGFEDLIGSIRLTTEAGRKLHAELLKLAPQFDLLYDGVEAFTDWLLGVDEVDRATKELEKVFADWGMSLPGTRDALLALYESGQLTTEQMAILGAYLRELGLVFDVVNDQADAVIEKMTDYTDLLIRLAAASGNDALALRLRREQELANAADNYARSLLRQIYAYEDAALAAEEAEAARRAAWEESERARRAAYDAEVEAIRAYNSAAEEAARAANEAAREALQKLQAAAERTYQIANDIAQAWIEALAAMGLETEATALSRRLQAAAMDPALRSVYEIVWQIQDAATSAAGRADLAIQALNYLGRDDDARTAERALTLASTAPDLRGLQEWVFQLEDARRAADEAAVGIEKLIDSLQAVSSAIAGTIERITDLMRASPAAAAQTRAAAQRDLSATLAAARAGTLPTTDSLERTLATLSEDPAALFGDRTSYLRDLGRTREELVALQGMVDAQVPIEEQNLEALKNLPAALYPNFEAIVASIGENGGNTNQLISDATAAVNAAIAAMQARDEALAQSITEINPTLKEIPPYIEDVYDEIGIQTEEFLTGLAGLRNVLSNIDLDGDSNITYEEMIEALGHVISRDNIQFIFDGLDVNDDGVISAIELMTGDLTPLLQAIDADGDGNLKWEEFQNALQYLASDEQLKRIFDSIDLNGDGIIDAVEMLQQTTILNNESMYSMIMAIKEDVDAIKNYSGFLENLANLSGFNEGIFNILNTWVADIAIDIDNISNNSGYLQNLANLGGYNEAIYNILNAWIANIGLDIDAINNKSSYLENIANQGGYHQSNYQKLTSIDGKIGATAFADMLSNLISIKTSATNVSNYAGYLQNIYNQGGYHQSNYDKLTSIDGKIGATVFTDMLNSLNTIKSYAGNISTYTSNISQYTYNSSLFLSQLVSYAATSNARGYATGGIASGPLSGYPVTLHGREAVIPLGDGNSVTAILSEPAPAPVPVINYLREEASETAELRAALAELQGEIAALRAENRSIGAATVGELKDHNRRERKREVTGQKVEVIS